MTYTPNRTVFFISDRTGITAETLGRSLITQFDKISFTQIALPFIDSIEKAKELVNQINATFKETGVRPILFTTIIQDDIRQIITNSDGFFIDFVHTFIEPLEVELQAKSTHSVGLSHSVQDSTEYHKRIEAVNYALANDDGSTIQNYGQADLILIGVSRSGKTPTSLYLAIQFGLRVANYPITEEDMGAHKLPPALAPYQKKILGLTIEPLELHNIRELRRPNSPYANLEQCQKEVAFVEVLYQEEKIPSLSSTHRSIEELATKIMSIMGIKRVMQ